MKQWLTTLFCSLALLWGGLQAAAAQDDPAALVRDTTDRVLAELKSRENVDAATAFELVREIVLPHFDFELMSRFVLARNWQQATPEQQQRFVEEFRTLLIRTYGVSLSEYSGQEIRYLPVHDTSGKRVTVRPEILQPGGPSIPLHHQLYRGPEGWKVFDVVIEGVSLVQNYRGEFAAEISRNGIDHLIERLAQRNRSGSAE